MAHAMHRHPYRSQPDAHVASRRSFFDRDLAVVYGVVWLGSLVRVALGFADHQPFGTELTLATLAIVLLPLLARSG